MHIPFFPRLYVRIWLAVVLAVLVLSILVGWLLRTQAERIRAERLAEVPAREVLIRNRAGEVIGRALVQPVRVPGRGVEFQVQLPDGVKGGEQLAISLPTRPRPEGSAPPLARENRWWGMGGGDWGGGGGGGGAGRAAQASLNFVMLLVAFAIAVALSSYPVVRRLTQRLQSLQRGVERLGAGDLHARVDESGRDEVAFLAKRFNLAADQVQALVHSQKSLLANASHELRSPLARIRMGLELMETAPNPALKAELSRNIAELDALIEEILLASRLDSQSQSAASGAAATALTSVRESVDLLALAAEEAARAGVKLDWQGSPSSSAGAVLPGDARLLRRMIRNLLENALRHGEGEALRQGAVDTPHKNASAQPAAEPNVRLSLKTDAGQIWLEVADRGPGVPKDERERIFEPFYRSAHASERHGGVGLGLSLVRSIARQHGGTVQCLSGLDGTGARFMVSLPQAGDLAT